MSVLEREIRVLGDGVVEVLWLELGLNVCVNIVIRGFILNYVFLILRE